MKTSTRKGCGCGAWGCGIPLVVLLMTLIAAAVLYARFQSNCFGLLSDNPIEIPVLELDGKEADALKNRFASIPVTVLSGEPGQFTFTEAELNGLVATLDDMEPLHGKVHFRLQDQALLVKASIPMESPGRFEGKYLNGDLALTLSAIDEQLHCYIKDVTINGKRPPRFIITAMGRTNLLTEAYEDKDMALILGAVEKVTIADAAITLHTRAGPRYITDAPLVIEPFQPSPDQIQHVTTALEQLSTATRRQEACEVALTTDDLNTFIAMQNDKADGDQPAWHAEITNGTLRVKGSIPLSQMAELDELDGKFINSTFELVTDGADTAELRVDNVTVNDKELPRLLKENMVDHNVIDALLKDADDETRQLLEGLQSLSIQGDRLVIKTR